MPRTSVEVAAGVKRSVWRLANGSAGEYLWSRMRRKSCLIVLALALAVSACTGCSAIGSKKSGTFHGHGISFRYPKNWAKATSTGVSSQDRSAAWTEAFSPPSSSKADAVFISESKTPVAITRPKLAAYASDIANTVSQLAKRAGGSLLAGPKLVSMGGLPGYSFRISAKTSGGVDSESRILMIWNGTTEYLLNCQHQTGGKAVAEIERGCKMIIASFKVD